MDRVCAGEATQTLCSRIVIEGGLGNPANLEPAQNATLASIGKAATTLLTRVSRGISNRTSSSSSSGTFTFWFSIQESTSTAQLSASSAVTVSWSSTIPAEQTTFGSLSPNNTASALINSRTSILATNEAPSITSSVEVSRTASGDASEASTCLCANGPVGRWWGRGNFALWPSVLVKMIPLSLSLSSWCTYNCRRKGCAHP